VAKSPDPFFVLSTRERTIFRSDVIKNTTKPNWQPAILATNEFDYFEGSIFSIDEPIYIDIYDWDPDGGHDRLVDRVITSIRQITLENPRIFLKPKGEINFNNVQRISSIPKSSSPAYKITASGKKIAKMDLRGSDPFF